jgi:hypothetical protein
VVSLVTAAGVKAEDYRYSATGVPFGIPLGDVNADGKVDGGTTGADYMLAFDQEDGGVYDARVDLNLDGALTQLDDVAIVAGQDGVATGFAVLTMLMRNPPPSVHPDDLILPGWRFIVPQDRHCIFEIGEFRGQMWDPVSCHANLLPDRFIVPGLDDRMVRQMYQMWCWLRSRNGKSCTPIRCKRCDSGGRGLYYDDDGIYLCYGDNDMLNNTGGVRDTVKHELLHAIQYEWWGPMRSCRDRLYREYHAYSLETACASSPNQASREDCLCKKACDSVVHDTSGCFGLESRDDYCRRFYIPYQIEMPHPPNYYCCVYRCKLAVAGWNFPSVTRPDLWGPGWVPANPEIQ